MFSYHWPLQAKACWLSTEWYNLVQYIHHHVYAIFWKNPSKGSTEFDQDPITWGIIVLNALAIGVDADYSARLVLRKWFLDCLVSRVKCIKVNAAYRFETPANLYEGPVWVWELLDTPRTFFFLQLFHAFPIKNFNISLNFHSWWLRYTLLSQRLSSLCTSQLRFSFDSSRASHQTFKRVLEHYIFCGSKIRSNVACFTREVPAEMPVLAW